MGAALGVILVALIGSIPFAILNARIWAVAICLTVGSAIAGIEIIKVVVEIGGRRIDGDIATLVAFVVPFVVLSLSIYAAWRVLNQDLKFDLIQKFKFCFGQLVVQAFAMPT
ncbi:hypothetical protein [Nostoc sp. MS1]|uniref:hypothetical protein n=1 Tax=Nostoc sp. MS1 TaxID=2764711 RepID=UPI001CC821DE|nr:hypothetical protein [Nostoc sp. MS1]BCL40219.1 hypothetical protein NSMS1_66660 [Nostoc sp. MS1]